MTLTRSYWSGVTTTISMAVVVWAMWYGLEYRRDVLVRENQIQIFRDMLTTSQYGFAVLNPEGLIVEWGPGMERIFGWKASEVLGSTPEFMMPEEYRAAHNFAMKKEGFQLSRSLIEVDCFGYTKSGDILPIHIVAGSFKNHRGYYHMAFFSRRDDRRVVQAPPPNPKQGPPPRPQPSDVRN